MQPSQRTPLTRLSLLSAALFLGACNTLEPGVDDYSNAKVDARSAGKSLSASFDQGKDWEAAFPAPTAPSLNLSTRTAALKKSTALPSAADLDFQIDLDDTAKGYATVSAETKGLLQTTYDTLVVKWDEKAKDTVKDNENIISMKRTVVWIGGKTETVFVTDADGNGIVNEVPGTDNRGRFVFTVSEKGTVETTEIVAGAGADGEFDTEADNYATQGVWIRTQDGVETAKGEYLDGDGDGRVGDNSKDQVVIVKWYEMNPAGRPFVKKAVAEAKVRVFAHKAGDEPISFSASEELVTGRVNAISMKNRHGGDSITKGDTLWVRIETTKSRADDTLQHAEITVVMNPGQDLKSEADDLVYAFHIKTQKRFGFERSAEFNFVAGEPVPHGEDAVSGTFDGKATYANGQSATLKGEFSPAGFSAEFTGPEGNTVKVEFTKSGDVI